MSSSYKAHLAVDEESGLVRQAEMTPAHVHDARLAEALIQGDEQGYFADKAYSDQTFRETLERRGLVDGVAWRGRPHHPLEPWRFAKASPAADQTFSMSASARLMLFPFSGVYWRLCAGSGSSIAQGLYPARPFLKPLPLQTGWRRR